MTTFGIILLIILFITTTIIIMKSTIYILEYDSVWIKIRNILGYTILSSLLSVIITGIIFFLFSIITYTITSDYKLHSSCSINIYGINVKSLSSGNFILGCGKIDNNEYYYYYEKHQIITSGTTFNNTYKLSKIENDKNTYVIQSVLFSPQILIEYNVPTKNYCSWIFKPEFFKEKSRTIIFVPENTIIENYNLKLSEI